MPQKRSTGVTLSKYYARKAFPLHKYYCKTSLMYFCATLNFHSNLTVSVSCFINYVSVQHLLSVPLHHSPSSCWKIRSTVNSLEYCVHCFCVCTRPERTLQRKERWYVILQIQPEEGFCFFSYYWNLLSVGNAAGIKGFLPSFLNFILYCISTQWPAPKIGKNTSVLVSKGVTTWLNFKPECMYVKIVPQKVSCHCNTDIRANQPNER